MISAILFISFFVFLILGLPIAICLGLSSVCAILYSGTSLTIVATNMYSGISKFLLLAIPFFVLSGNIMAKAGISKRLINFVDTCVGHKKGGIAIVCVIVACFFGAISGSGPATVAALGAVLIPAMVEQGGFSAPFSTALMATSSSIAIVIPPSIAFVVYASCTDTSVGALFSAGITPGILVGVSYLIAAMFASKNVDVQMLPKATAAERWKAFKEAFWALLMPVIILGGIYGGIFTPTEAAIIATFYAIFLGFFYRTLTLKKLLAALKEASETTCTVMMIVCGATIFCYILSFERFPQMVANLFLTYVDNKYMALFVINVFLVFVGMFMDSSPSIIILTPVFLPVVTAFGVDPVHFGIIMILNLMIGLLTPPVGMVLYVLSKVSSVPFERICKATVPYIIMFYIILQFITYIPQICLALPTWMYGA